MTNIFFYKLFFFKIEKATGLPVPPISWWPRLRESQLSWGVPLVSFYPTTFWKRMLPRPRLEPVPPDFRSGVLTTTLLGQGGECYSMGEINHRFQQSVNLSSTPLVYHQICMRLFNNYLVMFIHSIIYNFYIINFTQFHPRFYNIFCFNK